MGKKMTIIINKYEMTQNNPPNPMSVYYYSERGSFLLNSSNHHISPSHAPLLTKDGPTSEINSTCTKEYPSASNNTVISRLDSRKQQSLCYTWKSAARYHPTTSIRQALRTRRLRTRNNQVVNTEDTRHHEWVHRNVGERRWNSE